MNSYTKVFDTGRVLTIIVVFERVCLLLSYDSQRACLPQVMVLDVVFGIIILDIHRTVSFSTPPAYWNGPAQIMGKKRGASQN
jgi:hypothetical protein